MSRTLVILAACVVTLSTWGLADARTPFGGGFMPAGASPAILSITSVGPTGGAITVSGTGFTSTGLSFWCDEGAARALPLGFLTIASSTTTQIVAAVPATAAGTYSCILNNLGGGYVALRSLLNVTATAGPDTVLTTHLRGWYRADSGSVVAGSFTGITDRSGNGNTPTTINNVAQVAASAHFNNQPSFGLDGATSGFRVASFVQGGAASMFIMAAVYQASAGAAPVAAIYNGTESVQTSGATGKPTTVAGLQIWPTSIVGSPAMTYLSINGGTTSGISVANDAPLGASGTFTIASTAKLEMGCVYVGVVPNANFFSGEIAEIIVADVVPSSSDLLLLSQYMQLRYQLDPSPVFVASTNVGTSGGSFRVSGANFLSGTKVSAASGIGLMTCTFLSSVVEECIVPAGTYVPGDIDLTITNPDGGSLTVNDGLHIVSTDDVMSKLGTSVVGWYRADAVTLSGSSVTAIRDLSLRGNAPGTITAVSQNASNANFSSARTLTFNGTTSLAKVTGFNLASSAGAHFAVWSAVRFTSSTSLQAVVSYATAGTVELRASNVTSTRAQVVSNSAYTDSAGALTPNITRAVWADAPGGGGTQTVSVSVSNAAPSTLSGSGAAMAASADLGLGARPAGSSFMGGDVAEIVISNAAFTAPQLTWLESHAQSAYGVP